MTCQFLLNLVNTVLSAVFLFFIYSIHNPLALACLHYFNTVSWVWRRASGLS